MFLDEIGELTAEVQVKLLRVLQTRRFQLVGANEDKAFRGKIIAATDRDLVAEMQAGRFREDFYYRLCADKIETPPLRAQLHDRPEDLPSSWSSSAVPLSARMGWPGSPRKSSAGSSGICRIMTGRGTFANWSSVCGVTRSVRTIAPLRRPARG